MAEPPSSWSVARLSKWLAEGERVDQEVCGLLHHGLPRDILRLTVLRILSDSRKLQKIDVRH